MYKYEFISYKSYMKKDNFQFQYTTIIKAGNLNNMFWETTHLETGKLNKYLLGTYTKNRWGNRKGGTCTALLKSSQRM